MQRNNNDDLEIFKEWSGILASFMNIGAAALLFLSQGGMSQLASCRCHNGTVQTACNCRSQSSETKPIETPTNQRECSSCDRSSSTKQQFRSRIPRPINKLPLVFASDTNYNAQTRPKRRNPSPPRLCNRWTKVPISALDISNSGSSTPPISKGKCIEVRFCCSEAFIRSPNFRSDSTGNVLILNHKSSLLLKTKLHKDKFNSEKRSMNTHYEVEPPQNLETAPETLKSNQNCEADMQHNKTESVECNGNLLGIQKNKTDVFESNNVLLSNILECIPESLKSVKNLVIKYQDISNSGLLAQMPENGRQYVQNIHEERRNVQEDICKPKSGDSLVYTTTVDKIDGFGSSKDYPNPHFLVPNDLTDFQNSREYFDTLEELDESDTLYDSSKRRKTENIFFGHDEHDLSFVSSQSIKIEPVFDAGEYFSQSKSNDTDSSYSSDSRNSKIRSQKFTKVDGVQGDMNEKKSFTTSEHVMTIDTPFMDCNAELITDESNAVKKHSAYLLQAIEKWDTTTKETNVIFKKTSSKESVKKCQDYYNLASSDGSSIECFNDALSDIEDEDEDTRIHVLKTPDIYSMSSGDDSRNSEFLEDLLNFPLSDVPEECTTNRYVNRRIENIPRITPSGKVDFSESCNAISTEHILGTVESLQLIARQIIEGNLLKRYLVMESDSLEIIKTTQELAENFKLSPKTSQSDSNIFSECNNEDIELTPNSGDYCENSDSSLDVYKDAIENDCQEVDEILSMIKEPNVPSSLLVTAENSSQTLVEISQPVNEKPKTPPKPNELVEVKNNKFRALASTATIYCGSIRNCNSQQKKKKCQAIVLHKNPNPRGNTLNNLTEHQISQLLKPLDPHLEIYYIIEEQPQNITYFPNIGIRLQTTTLSRNSSKQLTIQCHIDPKNVRSTRSLDTNQAMLLNLPLVFSNKNVNENRNRQKIQNPTTVIQIFHATQDNRSSSPQRTESDSQATTSQLLPRNFSSRIQHEAWSRLPFKWFF